MTKEDRELLIKDLSARLPYEPNIRLVEYTNNTSGVTPLKSAHIQYLIYSFHGSIKPYLRPLSDMTAVEYSEALEMFAKVNHKVKYYPGGDFTFVSIQSFTLELLDWFNKKMFDYRGLIRRHLALKAPDDMYKELRLM